MNCTLIIFILSIQYGILYGNEDFNKFLRIDENKCRKSTNECLKTEDVLPNGTCLDIKYPYKNVVENYKDQLFIYRWTPLKAIPECWNYLQVLLCLIKFAPCFKKGAGLYYQTIAQEVCLATAEKCPQLIVNVDNKEVNKTGKIVDKTPFFLQCKEFQSHCFLATYNEMMENHYKFECQWPMVKTSKVSLWISGFSRCTFHCKTPNLSNEEYEYSRILFGSVGLIFLSINLVILVTFGIHRIRFCGNYQLHPMLLNLWLVHFYMCLGSLGWAVQLIPSVRELIICDGPNGALRTREPQTKIGESLACVAVFSLIYFPLIAASLTSLTFFYIIYSLICRITRPCYKATSFHSADLSTNQQETINNFKTCFDSMNNNVGKSINNRKHRTFLSKNFRFSLWRSSKSHQKVTRTLEKGDDPHIQIRKGIFAYQDVGDSTNAMRQYRQDHSRIKSQTKTSQIFVLLFSSAFLVISLTIVEIRADPISGICFIGSSASVIARLGLSLLPLFIILVAKTTIIIQIYRQFRVIRRSLVKLKLSGSDEMECYFRKLSSASRYFGFSTLLLWILCIFSVYSHGYLIQNESIWMEDLKLQFICQIRQKLMFSGNSFLQNSQLQQLSCPLASKPVINIFILHNVSYFALNFIFIIFSCCNKCFFLLWKRVLSFQSFRIDWTDGKKVEMNNSTIITNSHNFYYGLDNQTLLDGVWNPGLFVYLIGKKEKMKELPMQQQVAEKNTEFCRDPLINSTRIGDSAGLSAAATAATNQYQHYHTQLSSVSFCPATNKNSSLNSCVSLPLPPPTHSASHQYGPLPPPSCCCCCTEADAVHQHRNPMLDTFLNKSNPYYTTIPVHRSNSFAGRPMLLSKVQHSNSNEPRVFGGCGFESDGSSCSRILRPTATVCVPLADKKSTCRSQQVIHNPIAKEFAVLSSQQLIQQQQKKHHPKRYCQTSSRNRRFSAASCDNPRNISTKLILKSSKQSLSPRALSRMKNQQPKLRSQTIIQPGQPGASASHTTGRRHSSSCISGESYNSYRLLMQQCGGRWRDMCRTRMTLQDAMVWANAHVDSDGQHSVPTFSKHQVSVPTQCPCIYSCPGDNWSQQQQQQVLYDGLPMPQPNTTSLLPPDYLSAEPPPSIPNTMTAITNSPIGNNQQLKQELYITPQQQQHNQQQKQSFNLSPSIPVTFNSQIPVKDETNQSNMSLEDQVTDVDLSDTFDSEDEIVSMTSDMAEDKI